MKYQSSNTKQIFELSFDTGRKKRYKCPECADSRKKAKNKDLEFYPESNRAYCFHCNTTLFEYKPFEKKQYKAPEWKNKTDLTDKSVKWFTSRMISQETLMNTKIYSDKEWMPQFKKEIEVICFPYFYNEKLINIKFRGANKSFKLNSGSELIFWNLDCITKFNEIIICEGEIDALTWIENGYQNVLSVPNGANKNPEYLDNYIHLFDDKEKIYLSTDNDSKGIDLRDELIRRLGEDKCFFVDFKECKDANEFYCKYHSDEFKNLIPNAKQIKVNGVVLIEDIQRDLISLYENGIQPGKKIGIDEIDKYITWETSRLAIATGVPGSGKSEFVDYLVTKLNLLHGWKTAYFTPENYPLKFHYAKIFEKFIGREFKHDKATNIDFDIAYEHLKNNFYYIMPEDNLSLDQILKAAKFFIKSKGIKVLVIDPYNKLDHQYGKNESETQYISKLLDKLILFGKVNDILIILIAHPRKMDRGMIPTLYDISGSAHFYNKADYGFTVTREFNDNNLMGNGVEVHWQKIKFKHLGEQGVSSLRWNYQNGRYEIKDGDVNSWDNSNWLVNNQIIEQPETIQTNEEFNYTPSDDPIPF